jgi:hypothetical protein
MAADYPRGRCVRREAALFALALMLEAFVLLLLCATRRMVAGHDGFQYFSLQYYFLNDAAYAGEVPQWLPYMTHGTVATWWYAIQGSLLQNVLLLAARALRTVHFLTVFYTNAFIDELVLGLGTWLLCKRFFASTASVFFVTATVLASSMWTTQPWYNLHFYYALPLILWLLHRFLDEARWRYLALAANLTGLQTLGNLPYFLPVLTMVIFVYALSYASLNRHLVARQVRALSWRWGFAGAVVVAVVSFGAAYAVLCVGTDSILNYNDGRNLDGTTPYSVFMTYAGNLDLRKYFELGLGFSPALDYTLYMGVLSLPLMALGLVRAPRGSRHFAIVCAFMLLFGCGTFVSSAAYYAWPMMRFYRHLALVCCFVKLFACVVAGFGLDHLVARGPSRRFANGAGILLLVLAAGLLTFARDGTLSVSLARRLVRHGLVRVEQFLDPSLLSFALTRSSIFALAFGALLAISGRLNWQKRSAALIATVLAVHLADLYSWKALELKVTTYGMSNQEWELTRLRPMPYVPSRSAGLIGETNPRELFLQDRPEKMEGTYWSTQSFLFEDELGSDFRTDHWLAPLDDLLRVYSGQPVRQKKVPPLFRTRGEFRFPIENRAAREVCGATGKVQFFRVAHEGRDEEIARHLARPDATGRVLLVDSASVDDVARRRSQVRALAPIATDEKLALPYEVRWFSSNRLDLAVDAGDREGAWLVYADVWHPLWKVTVNGVERAIAKANLAYKAVWLDSGMNEVRFRFHSRALSFWHAFFAIDSFTWILILVALTRQIGRRHERGEAQR